MKLKPKIPAWSKPSAQLSGKKALSCLSTVRALSKQIAGSDNVSDLLHRVLRAALRESDSEVGLIGLLDPSADQVEIVSQVGWRLGDPQSGMIALSASPLLASAMKRRTSFSGSLAQQHNAHPGPSERPTRSHFFMAMPLTPGRNGKGILLVARKAPTYAAHDKISLETLAALAAVCLEKRQLQHTITSAAAEQHASAPKLQPRGRLADMGFIAGSIVHELRQPLSTIQMIASYLKARMTPAEGVSKQLETLEQQAELAGKILSGLVSFARSGKPQKSASDVHQILDAVLERNVSRSEIKIEKKFDGQLPFAMADPLHVDRIISNLITNGIDSMERGGTLSISTRADGDGVTLEIADTGCGVQPDCTEKIFEPFVTTKQNGTGLGLALCRHLAEANGGSVIFHNREGRGSRFELRLPRA